MAALCYVSYVAGNSGGGSSNGVAVAETAAGLPISAMKKVLANAAPAPRDLLLPSGTAEQRAEVSTRTCIHGLGLGSGLGVKVSVDASRALSPCAVLVFKGLQSYQRKVFIKIMI